MKDKLDELLENLHKYQEDGFVISDIEDDRCISVRMEDFMELALELKLNPDKVNVSIDYKGYKIYGYID